MQQSMCWRQYVNVCVSEGHNAVTVVCVLSGL